MRSDVGSTAGVVSASSTGAGFDWVWYRDGGQQFLRVGMGRLFEHLSAGSLFDDLAVLHHCDLGADLADDCEVMGDEQHGQVEPLLHVDQEVEDLSLNGTSSADTGSSQIRTSGSTATARAMAMR